jgi:hypothetical protein
MGLAGAVVRGAEDEDTECTRIDGVDKRLPSRDIVVVERLLWFNTSSLRRRWVPVEVQALYSHHLDRNGWRFCYINVDCRTAFSGKNDLLNHFLEPLLKNRQRRLLCFRK